MHRCTYVFTCHSSLWRRARGSRASVLILLRQMRKDVVFLVGERTYLQMSSDEVIKTSTRSLHVSKVSAMSSQQDNLSSSHDCHIWDESVCTAG